MVLPRSGASDRSRIDRNEASPLVAHGRSCGGPLGNSRGRVPVELPKQLGRPNRFPKAASHRFTTEVVRRRKTRSVGIRRLLPWGSFPFGVCVWAIVVPVCLTDTVRSRGFSPSQRLDPAQTSWLCFTPHPPLGFRTGLQSFSHSASRDVSRRPLLSCRSSWRQLLSSELEMGLCPCLRLPRLARLSPPLLQWLPVHPQK
jgi:hypothetical protein